MKDDKLIKDNVIGNTSTMPTPTTSPLIEGIIEEFEEKFILKYVDGSEEFPVSGGDFPEDAVSCHTPKEMKDFLSSSLQKIESETVERCLKALPSKNFCREDNHLDAAINIGFRTCYKQSLSAIKKEFNKE